MTILTSYASSCHKAQIRSSLAAGFRKLYTGSSTESDGRAARNLVAKFYGTLAAGTVREVTAKSEITALIGNFMDDPKRKQVFRIWTYTTQCTCCGTECDHHIPQLESDPANGLSYSSFEITVQALPHPIWRFCRRCQSVTRNFVAYYEANN